MCIRDSRKRRMAKVAPQYGGKPCVGHSHVTESCNFQECPGEFIVSWETNILIKNITFLTTFSCKLHFTEITETQFNTTCCRQNGVPEECIGNCENVKFRSFKLPSNMCDQFKKKIDECIILSGNFETHRCNHTKIISTIYKKVFLFLLSCISDVKCCDAPQPACREPCPCCSDGKYHFEFGISSCEDIGLHNSKTCPRHYPHEIDSPIFPGKITEFT